jgi:hypothetical protein
MKSVSVEVQYIYILRMTPPDFIQGEASTQFSKAG